MLERFTSDTPLPGSIEEFYEIHKPSLRRAYAIMLESVREFVKRDDLAEDLAHRLTLASEHVYLDERIIATAGQRNEIEAFARTLYALSRIRTSFARLLASSYGSIRFSLREAGTLLVEEVSEGFRRMRKPDEVLSFCFRSASTEQCMVFLRLFGTMARHAPQSVPAFFDLFERIRKTSSWQTIRQWIARGVDLVSSGRTEEGIAFLLGLSRESRNLLGMQFAVLGDRKNVLHIYCTSFGGRVYGIHDFAVSMFGLKRPYTDGVSIFLPETIDLFGSIRANESAYTVLATLQASFVQSGTFAFDERRIDFAEVLQRRYGTVLPDIMGEVERQYGPTAQTVRERPTGEVEAVFGNDRVLRLLETPHELHFYRYPTPDLVRELFAVFERFRVEARIASRYPGYREDIDRVNRAIESSFPPVTAIADSLTDELEAVLASILRMSLGAAQQTHVPDRMRRMLASIDQSMQRLTTDGADVYTTMRVCFDVYNLLYDTYPVVLWCREHDVRELFYHRSLATIAPEIVADVAPELVTGKIEREEFVSEEDPEEEEIDLTSLSKTERKAHDLRQALLSGNIQIFRYPEYDVYRGSYRQKHCTLYESVLDSGDPEVYRAALDTHQQTYKKLKKRFLFMQPDALSIQRKWLVGEEIHISDATDYVTDLMRGSTPDEKIYVRRNRNERSIAAAVLVDASSSTEEQVNGRRIIEIERTALSLLASVLSIVGDTFCVYTFFSMGRSNVFVSAVKRFEESWNEQTQSRIASIEANASNRDGCAIRHVTARLLEQDERTRLLILLSDGIPADPGYGSGGSAETNAYAIEDTRRAILEARMRGIIPYCITIDRHARDYTPRLYGEFHYTVLPDVSRLPEKLSNLYLRLTK